MSEIAPVIDSLVRDALGPPLKAAGYRKSARTFRHRGPVCTRVVNVQASPWNAGTEGSFTINLGVYFPAMASLLEWIPMTDQPTESDCLLRQRIGFLLPVGQDHWWAVGPDTDRDALRAELSDAWSLYASPWMDAHDSLVAARTHVLQLNMPWWAAAISLALGEPLVARECLDKAIVDTEAGGFSATRLRAWGAQHDVLPQTAA